MYRLGKQGKAMAMITLTVENPDLTVADVTELKLKEEFIQRQLVRMNKDEPSKSLEDIYADQPPMLDRISQIREALKETQKELCDQSLDYNSPLTLPYLQWRIHHLKQTGKPNQRT